jgi:imidazolonepropionase-like amidohydrolase
MDISRARLYGLGAVLIVLVSSVVVATVFGQVAGPDQRLLIRNANLFDGTGAALRPGTDILIEAGKVQAVGPNLKAPADVRVIDAAGAFVMPGIIDCHVHLDAPIVFQVTPTEKEEIVANSPKAFLYNGVTTVLNVGSPADWIFRMRDDQRAGRLLSPRIYATGKAFTPDGGWGSRHGGTVNTPEETRALIREYVTRQADGIKMLLDHGLGGSHTYKVMPEEVLQAIADETHRVHLPLHVHAINLEDYRLAVPLKPRAIHHGLSDPLSPADPLIKQMVDGHIALVPTIALFESFNSFDGHPERFDDPVLRGSVPTFLLEHMRRPEFRKVEKQRFSEVARMDVYPWAKRVVPIIERNTKRMYDAGVKVGVGTDAGGPVGYNFQGYQTPREVELLVECGLTPTQALVAATRDGAEIIGAQDRLGTIEPGKFADLLILDASPLSDIHNIRKIRAVIVGGVAYARSELAYRPRSSPANR